MNKVINNSLLYLAQIAISGVLMLVLMPIVSQYLTPDELGQFVLAQVYSGIAVGIANFGVLVGYTRNFFIFEKSNRKSAQLIFTAVMFASFNLLLLLILVYLYQTNIAQMIFSNNHSVNLLLTVLVGTSASSLSQYYLAYLKNSGMAKSYVSHMIAYSIVNFAIAIIVLMKTNLGPMSLAYAWAASNLILFFLLFTIHSKKLPVVGFSVEMLREMLKISIPLTPRVFFGSLNTQLDKILLGVIGSTSVVGIYHIGQTLALFVFQFITGLGRVFQPEIYRKLFAEKHHGNSDEISNYMLPFFYFSIFLSLLIVTFSNEFVLWFLSKEFIDAIIVIIILTMYYSLFFFRKITGAQLIYAKKTFTTTLLMLTGMVVNIILNVPFIIKWGIVGAAWATTITGVLMTIVGYFFAQKYARILWHWRLFFIIYSVFLLSVIWTLIDYHGVINMSYITIFLVKLFLVGFYIFLGFKLTIIDMVSIKSTIFSLMRNK